MQDRTSGIPIYVQFPKGASECLSGKTVDGHVLNDVNDGDGFDYDIPYKNARLN